MTSGYKTISGVCMTFYVIARKCVATVECEKRSVFA
jgi:hypothetical protein